MVLLKNDNDLLPLAQGTKGALFGKGSFDYVKGAATGWRTANCSAVRPFKTAPRYTI